MRSRLGWLGPVLVIFGLGVGSAGAWYYAVAAPVAGGTIDTIGIDASTFLVVRAEADGDRSFLELHDTTATPELQWQALIPRYAGSAGRRGVSWGQGVVTIRVERGGEDELWVLGLADAVKVASLRLAPEHEPIPPQAGEPLSVGDGERTYELVAGADWHELVAIDLKTGQALWKQELGPARFASMRVVGPIVQLFPTSGSAEAAPGELPSLVFDTLTGRKP
jgi:hypothetical protein